MKAIKNVGLENVQAVYSGPEGDLWELVMGEQIHIGAIEHVDRFILPRLYDRVDYKVRSFPFYR